ncbi:MAG: TonB-dependent receptor [Bacteroidota bacterium]
MTNPKKVIRWAIAVAVCCLMGLNLSAQTVTIKGSVRDATDDSPLEGATYGLPAEGKGGITDENGQFEIKATRAPEINVLIRSLGYGDTTLVVTTESGKSLYELNITLGVDKNSGITLGEVVFIEGRHAKDLSKVTASVEVVNSEKVDLQVTNEVEDALTQAPGVDIIDGQPNIRGSSGYAYGVGSRVMVMLNGLPLLSPDAAFAQFDLIPVDNINQIEIMKGASSVLYGSSALGGVINVLTSDAPDTAKTSIRAIGTIFDAPRDPRLDWDGDGNATEGSINVFHSRKFGKEKNNDITLLGGFWKESGWRNDTEAEQGRVMVMTKFRPKKIPGMNWGVNASYRFDSSSTFLFWDSYLPADTVEPFVGAPIPNSAGALSGQNSRRRQFNDRFTIDPFVRYLTKKNNLHYYRGRIMGNRNTNDTEQNNNNRLVYNDYQYTTRLWPDKTTGKERITWVSGISNQLNFANGDSLYGDVQIDTTGFTAGGDAITDTTLIGGNYTSVNVAVYTQMDAEITPRLNASVGARYDYWYIGGGDQYGNKVEQAPIFRAGMNYNTFAGNNIRASFGQAFRSPSVAERFTSTNASGLLILPNPDIQVEKGWSAELGIRQGFRTGGRDRFVQGYLDVAGFMMDYDNMIEFGVALPDSLGPTEVIQYLFTNDPSFSARNVADARISGVEVTTLVQAGYDDFFFNFSGGVTWLDPRNLNPADTANQVDILNTIGPQDSAFTLEALGQFAAMLFPEGDPNKLYDNPEFLKYRSRWLARFSATVGYGRFALTTNLRYKSFVERIDEFLYIAIPGSADWVKAHPSGFTLVDFIATVDLVDGMKLSLACDNAFNTEWAELPGIIGRQRNFSLQFKYVF